MTRAWTKGLRNGSRQNRSESVVTLGRSKGTRGTCTPIGVQILSISCSFWEKLAKSYVGAPWRVAPPPPGNPGSATGDNYQGVTNNFGGYYGTWG